MLSESEEESTFGVCSSANCRQSACSYCAGYFQYQPPGSPYPSELQSMLDAVKPQGYSLDQQVLHKIGKFRSLLLFRL